jgi:hypothetical protein
VAGDCHEIFGSTHLFFHVDGMARHIARNQWLDLLEVCQKAATSI